MKVRTVQRWLRLWLLVAIAALALARCNKEEGGSLKAEKPKSAAQSQTAEGETTVENVAACLETGQIEPCMAALTQTSDARALIEEASSKCEQASPNWCLLAALMVHNGTGTDRNQEREAGFYQKSCEGNNLDSCHMLSLMYDKGEGVPVDGEMARGLLVKACKGDHPGACFRLGLDLTGQKDDEDKELGLTLLKKACSLGNSYACDAAATEEQWEKQDAEREGTLVAAPVVSRFVGIDWIVEGEIATRFQIKKVTCKEPFRKHRMCEVTIAFPAGWEIRQDGMVYGRILDGDGVQTGKLGASEASADPGLVTRQKFRVDTDTKQVVFGL